MSVPIRKPNQSGGSGQLQLETFSDMSGGLNLDDFLKLDGSETPDCLNVVFDRLGGFRSRRGVDQIYDWGSTNPVFQLIPGADPFSILAIREDNVGIWNDQTQSWGTVSGGWSNLGYRSWSHARVQGWTWVTKGITDSGPDRSSRVNTSNSPFGLNAPDDLNLTTLGWIEDLNDTLDPDDTSPGVDHRLPRAQFCCGQHNRLWMANTWNYNMGTSSYDHYPNRVRFSHPGGPTSWRENDWIDIDDDGDEITAIKAVDDVVLVFKRRSIHVIAGDAPENFQVVPLAQGVGAVHDRAVKVGLGGCWFVDPERGLFQYSNGQLQWVGQKIHRLFLDELIDLPSLKDLCAVGIVGSDVWVSLPGAPGYEDATYVYQSALGAWTKFDLFCIDYLQWDNGSKIQTFAIRMVGPNRDKVLRLDQDQPYDTIGGSNTVPTAYWQSAWVTGGVPTERKRWGRPRVVSFSDAETMTLRVEAMVDYLPAVSRSVVRSLDGDGADDFWVHDFKGPSTGASKTASYRVIHDYGTPTQWGVQSIGIRYRQPPLKR